MITYPTSSNSCKKILCNVIGFTIFDISEAATGSVLLEMAFLQISQNLQENTCGKVSFLIKLQAEATASDLSYVFLFDISEAATGSVLLEMAFLQISQNLQENTCGKVSFLIKLQAEATASDLSYVFS